MVKTAVLGATALHPLREARLRRGLSQEALAYATRPKLDPRTIRRIERGTIPYPETARILASYFKCSPASLGLVQAAGGRQAVLPAPQTPPPARAPELAGHLRRVLAEFSSLDNLLGPGPLLAVVPAQLAAVEQLLGDASPETRGELLDVVARSAELAGWVHQDAGDLVMADRWTARAADYALAAGDPRLVSYVLMRRSNIASDDRDAGRALALAQAALRDADRLTPQLRAVALRQEAHAHALRRDTPASARALDRAMGQLGAGGGGEPEFDLTAYCTPGYLGMEAAACWLQLGEPKRAIATFERRLSSWPAGYKRDLGLCLARLAVAHAADQDLEQAETVGREAVAVVRGTRSARTLRELARLEALLAPWGGVGEVAELRRAVSDVTRPAASLGGPPWS